MFKLVDSHPLEFQSESQPLQSPRHVAISVLQQTRQTVGFRNGGNVNAIVQI